MQIDVHDALKSIRSAAISARRRLIAPTLSSRLPVPNGGDATLVQWLLLLSPPHDLDETSPVAAVRGANTNIAVSRKTTSRPPRHGRKPQQNLRRHRPRRLVRSPPTWQSRRPTSRGRRGLLHVASFRARGRHARSAAADRGHSRESARAQLGAEASAGYSLRRRRWNQAVCGRIRSVQRRAPTCTWRRARRPGSRSNRGRPESHGRRDIQMPLRPRHRPPGRRRPVY